MGVTLNFDKEARKKREALWNEWSYDFEHWTKNIGFHPVELVFQKDMSESYEMNRVHVFKNERGDYAIVHERGCSCYMSDEASIDFCDDEKEAVKRAINLL